MEGFGIVTENGLATCLEVKVENCLEPDYASAGPSFKCKVCNTSFYLNESKTCTAVPKTIENCALYSDKDTCSLCLNDKVLDKNAKNCITNNIIEQQRDINCENSRVTNTAVCNICKPGFKFNDSGVCESCFEKSADGCMACHPEELNCIICKIDYI